MDNKTPKVLVVDDEPADLEKVCRLLDLLDCYYETASDGKEGQAKLTSGRFDVAVIDMELPEVSGAKVILEAKYLKIKTWIIAYTGKLVDEDNAVAGYRIGADEYIRKNTGEHELLTLLEKRLSACRTDGFPNVVCWDDFEFDMEFRILYRREGGERKPVEISATDANILYCIIRFNGKPVSYEYIADHIMGYLNRPMDYKANIQAKVKDLKKTLGMKEGQERGIVTIRGIGYAFII